MKAWQKPLLIALVRSRPEEAILTFCKGESSGTNPLATNLGCWGVNSPPLAAICSFCYTTGGS